MMRQYKWWLVSLVYTIVFVYLLNNVSDIQRQQKLKLHQKHLNVVDLNNNNNNINNNVSLEKTTSSNVTVVTNPSSTPSTPSTLLSSSSSSTSLSKWDQLIDQSLMNKSTLFICGKEFGQTSLLARKYYCGDSVGWTEWTSDESLLEQSNGQVYFGADVSHRLYTNSHSPKTRDRDPIKIDELASRAVRVYFNLEPPDSPIYSACDRSARCMGLFNWSIGWQDRDVIKLPVFSRNGLLSLEESGAGGYDFNYYKDLHSQKSHDRLVSWMAYSCSNETTDKPFPRTLYVGELMKHCKVDSYGRCLNNKEMPVGGDRNSQNASLVKKEVISQYKFYLAFENTNCPGYISEKIFECYVAGVVPVISAHPSVHRQLPPDSYIDMEQFDSIGDLAAYLNYLNYNTDLYSSFFNWRRDPEYIKQWIDSFPSTRYATIACQLHKHYLSSFTTTVSNKHPSTFTPPTHPSYSIKYDAKDASSCYQPFGLEDFQVNWCYLSIFFIVFDYVFNVYLNIRQSRKLRITKIPPQLDAYEITTPDQFIKSQDYGYDKLIFSTFHMTFGVVTNVLSFMYGLNPLVWKLSKWILNNHIYETDNEIIISIAFLFIYSLFNTITELPFSLYKTFVLEEKHGFNNTTIGLFIKDTIISLLLMAAIGPIIIGVIVYVIQATGPLFWLYTWIVVFAISLIMMTIYPTLIAPLFNKYSPVEGELKESILALAKRVDFPATKLFVVDNSKRSGHMNAYFYGFFKNKRIVLYDTLIKELEEEDVLAVLCHEFGHYKMSHTLRLMALQQVYILGFFYLFGLFMNDVKLFNDFGFHQETPVFVGLLLFGLIFHPVSQLFSFVVHIFSRKFEYEADKYAFDFGYDLSNGLAKLHIKDSSSLLVDTIVSIILNH
ncbi:CAAX prenyl protease [Cavenderia fasciculata]|uniref:Fucosyltransferase n=1 Tax=Cavenderia fasciculata TaxID=261658 RepID=F4PH23_CACFS|nr:CAAX prenyl protease [Cavenderia fasciculata]EGG25007.1 CAAX prenyl protease [Cavenderia fasciculata]|eukprot:XP_004362858.1 CAAX prenyl protease [Cavenderia fasciculata]